MAFGVTVTEYTGSEVAFVPPAVPPVEFELLPVEPGVVEEVKYVDPWLPQPTVYVPFVAPKPQKRCLVVNVETTGLSPLDSRIISITVLDPVLGEAGPRVLIAESDRDIVVAFLSMFEEGGFNELVAFNVSFDYRFIYAAMLRYRLQCKAFIDTGLYDVMQQVKQVKQSFVPGYNKSGTLDQWAKYLLGFEPPFSQMDSLMAWEKGDWDKHAQFAEYKVEACYLLWGLHQYCAGLAFLEEETVFEEVLGGSPHELLKARCPNCLQEAFVPMGQSLVVCDVCEEHFEPVQAAKY